MEYDWTKFLRLGIDDEDEDDYDYEIPEDSDYDLKSEEDMEEGKDKNTEDEEEEEKKGFIFIIPLLVAMILMALIYWFNKPALPTPIIASMGKEEIITSIPKMLSGLPYPPVKGLPEVSGDAEQSEEQETSEAARIETETTEEQQVENNVANAGVTKRPNVTSKPAKEPAESSKKVEVIVTIKNVTSVYGEQFKALDYDVKGALKSEISKYITVTKQEGRNAGQYWITGTYNDLQQLFDVTFVPGIYTILPREVTLQAEDKESFVGDTLKTLTYTTVSGSIVNGDKVVELSTKAEPAKAGTYNIVGKCINSNYKLTVKVGKYTVKAKGSSSSETNPINVTVKILDKFSYYGDKITDLDFSVTKGDVKKDELKKYIRLEKADGNKVGNYAITGKSTGDKYKVTFENIGTYSIKARKLSIKVDDKESFVGEALATLTYSVISGSVVAGDEVIELSTNADSAKVGNYDITAKSKNPNYDVTIENKGTYTVKEKPAQKVTVQIADVTVTYGDIIPDFDFSISSGNVTKAEITPYITLSKDGDNNGVGEYIITGVCTKPEKYDVTFTNGKCIITKRLLSVKADDKQTYEGEALVDLTYTLTAGSIVNGDDVILLTSDVDPVVIGEYPITVTCKNSNYDVQSEGATYRVKAKPQPPKDEEEVGPGSSDNPPSSSGPNDQEEVVSPVKPTPYDPAKSEEESSEDADSGNSEVTPPADDPSDEVQPSVPTPSENKGPEELPEVSEMVPTP